MKAVSFHSLPWFLGWWKPTPWNDKTVCQQQELLLFLSLKLLFHLYTTGAIWRVTAREKWHQTWHNHTSYLYPSVIALDETCSRQHSRTCDGQTILSVSSSSGGGEERSSSPDIKLSYLFTASQMMPDNRNISLGPSKYASLKIWWKGRQLVYSTPIIFGNGNELFMSPLDAMEIHDPWITLGKQNTSTRCSYMENEKEGESERRVVLRG